jgi:glucose-6-phosphate isomerase
MSNTTSLWQRYKSCSFFDGTTGFSLDYSRFNLPDSFIDLMTPGFNGAYSEMSALERGAIANPDEKRMVGHYWLRTPELAPAALQSDINAVVRDVKDFAGKIRSGAVRNQKGEGFKFAIIVGIGGSALGPQFVNHALRKTSDSLQLFFMDNTDADGMSRIVDDVPELSKTLVVVISKSGGTKETRNGQVFLKKIFQEQGLSLAQHFVAITGVDSELDKTATGEKWLKRFPMWDWIGGRTSELSVVGLLPAALQGRDVDQMLAGAAAMDQLTRSSELRKNPAGLLAVLWFYVTGGRGEKAMVVLPYKDRFELLSKYLQQLVMESLGKELSRDGEVVNQGISVYGNKGSTDQHAYVQQLRDGTNNFFATFIQVLKDGGSPSASCMEVEAGITPGDYLRGFLYGTRKALYQNNRESLTIGVVDVSEYSVGLLIALFERAVGYYASLVNVNAYHQPGVEAGKKAATEILSLQTKLTTAMANEIGVAKSAEEWAVKIGGDAEDVFHILRHLAANGRIECLNPENWVLAKFCRR